MPLPLIVEATLQAALMNVVSNVLAQYIQSSKKGVELEIDWIPVFQFILFAMLTAPLNYLWQDFLESTFPAHPPPPHPKKSDDPPPPPKLSLRNTAIKLALDQTLGATVNTLLFSTINRSLQAAMTDAPRETNIFKAMAYWNNPGAIDFASVDFAEVWRVSTEEFWPILRAGWSVWPAVATINYTLVPTVQGRNLLGGLCGIAWGTYMSMIAAE